MDGSMKNNKEKSVMTEGYLYSVAYSPVGLGNLQAESVYVMADDVETAIRKFKSHVKYHRILKCVEASSYSAFGGLMKKDKLIL